MTDFISKIYVQGLLLQIYEAERNIFIWQHVAENIGKLETQREEIRQLYSFIQFAAQTYFVLALGKLFDSPSKKYPTQCILYFLEQLDINSLGGVDIIEKDSTKSLLKEYGAPLELVEAVSDDRKELFPRLLAKFYHNRYISESIDADIKFARLMRDKVVAHNEVIDGISFEFEVANRLLKFATEIVSVFGMAYHSTIWGTERISLITENARRNAWFVKSELDSLVGR